MIGIRTVSLKLKNALLVAVLLASNMLGMGMSLLLPQTVNAAPLCTVDQQGANDEPGQKDLTKYCADTTGVTSVSVGWQWDETSWSGANTGDACILFDTDNDTNINNALCATINGPSTLTNVRAYSCSDNKTDRCTNPVLQSTTSNCSVSVLATQPFASGASSPNDATALCAVVLADVGGTSAVLKDVCSYPSQIPNSDPSDCIVIDTSNGTPSQIEIKKVVSPSNDDGTFNLLLNGVTQVSNVGDGGTTGKVTVDKGTYTVSESAFSGSLANYSTSIKCLDSKNKELAKIDSGTSLSVYVDDSGNGVSVTCTITNTRKTGSIKVVKDVVNDNGGTKTAANFTFKNNGGTAQSFTATSGEDGEKVLSNLPVGSSFSIVEVEANTMGYTTTYSGTCSGTVTTAQQVCTIKNDDQAGTLTVNKVVVNDNGGTAQAKDFSFKRTGDTTSYNFVNGTDTKTGSKSFTVNAGTYSAVEDTYAGYSMTGNTCTNIVVANGGTASCTITNDDIAPKLTLTKIFNDLYNSGYTSSSWTLTATGTTSIEGEGSATSSSDFKAGSYTLAEEGPTTGIINGTWDCGRTTVTGNVITIALGAVVNCTITNTAVQPKITLTKVIDGDTYGDATTVNQFGLTIGGVAATSGTTYGKNVGSYSINEAGHDGYEFVEITGDKKCPTELGGAVNLALGDNVSCTIHNKAKAPKLTLVKVAKNDNGGTVLSGDFTLYAGENKFTGGDSIVDKDDSTKTTTSYVTGLGVGTYQLSEKSVDGYTPTKWSCTSGLSYGKVTVKLGDDITCTITNDDQQGKLVVNKVVINDNSDPTDITDEKEANDFSFRVSGDTTDYAFVNSNDNTLLGSKELKLNAGSYTVTENETEGYTMTDTTCDSVEVKNGATTYCTITNDDIAHPQIKVEKFGPDSAYEGDTVLYMFVVTNPGDVALNNVFVSDNIAENETYSYGDTNMNGLLDTNETWVYFADYTIPADTQDNVVNVVTVCAQENKPMIWDLLNFDDSEDETVVVQPVCVNEEGECIEGNVCATDDHSLDVVHPQINVVKTGPATALAGTIVTYTFTVTNAGDIALDTLTVEDSITGTATYVSGDTNDNDVLDLDETWIYTADYTIPADQTAPVTNTVTVCSLEHFNMEEDIELSRVSNNQEDAVQERDKICDQDSHTLTIPQVLSETTTEPTPLVNTGAGSMIYVQIIAMLNLLAVIALTVLAKRQKNN